MKSYASCEKSKSLYISLSQSLNTPYTQRKNSCVTLWFSFLLRSFFFFLVKKGKIETSHTVTECYQVFTNIIQFLGLSWKTRFSFWKMTSVICCYSTRTAKWVLKKMCWMKIFNSQPLFVFITLKCTATFNTASLICACIF